MKALNTFTTTNVKTSTGTSLAIGGGAGATLLFLLGDQLIKLLPGLLPANITGAAWFGVALTVIGTVWGAVKSANTDPLNPPQE